MTTPEFTANRDNFCYRHPGRQSFVLCQRCMRTVCAECQTPAPVGVICPECMKEQRKSESPAQRRARRQWGMRGRAGSAVAIGGTPIVTAVIIAVTVFVGLLQLIPGFGDLVTRALWFYTPYVLPQISLFPLEPWRLLTAALVHGSVWHLGLNMLALWMIGRSLEPMLGRARFLTLYLISALGGSVAVALLSPLTPVIGASGAVFGLMGALFVIGRHLGANVTGIVVILGINLALGFLPGAQISWQAHVGGLVVGALVAFIFARTRKASQKWVQIGMLAALSVVLLLVVFFVPPLLLTA